MDPHHNISSYSTHNKTFNPIGIRLGIDYVSWRTPQMNPPHIKWSCGTQNETSNAMGIGLQTVYVPWRNVPKCIPATSNLHVGQKVKRPSYEYQVRNGVCHMEEYPKTVPSHIKSSCGTQSKNFNPMGIRLRIDYATWRNIQKWIPSTSNLHLGHKVQFSILWV